MQRPLRWAVVGMGHFAQTHVLPAFRARGAGELRFIVTEDPTKARALSRAYDTEAIDYDHLDSMLRSDEVDVVYVTVPNHRHRELTVRALRAGKHVLCEKPMAVSVRECREMAQAAEEAGVKLMIGYRLHFEKANLAAVDLIRAGRLGEPRFFSSAFSFQVEPDNVRTLPTHEGGGVLYDVGVYCINAARSLFGEEPVCATAVSASRPGDGRFEDNPEHVSAVLEFPEGKLASFVMSFGAASVNFYTVAGTEGSLSLEPAYSLASPMHLVMTTRKGRNVNRRIDKHDQVAAELVYFNECIRDDVEPEPSAEEGIADVAIVEAILRSAREGRPIPLGLSPRKHPTGAQARQRRAPAKTPKVVSASGPGSS